MKRNKNNRKNFKIKKNNFQSRLTKQNVLNVGPCQGDPFNIPTNSLQKAISTAIYAIVPLNIKALYRITP